MLKKIDSMDHLKKYNENTLNNFIQISRTEWGNWSNKKLLNFTIEELKVVKKFFSIIQRSGSKIEGIVKLNTKHSLYILNLFIDKYDDDWFLVICHESDYGEEQEDDDPTGYSYYKCDQIDGLEEFMIMIKNRFESVDSRLHQQKNPPDRRWRPW